MSSHKNSNDLKLMTNNTMSSDALHNSQTINFQEDPMFFGEEDESQLAFSNNVSSFKDQPISGG